MSSSTELHPGAWRPALDLTVQGLSRFDPAKVEQAIAEGYEAGFTRGHHDALESGVAQVADQLARVRAEARRTLDALATAGAQLAAEEDALGAAFADRVVEAAMAVAEAVIGAELAEPARAVAHAAHRALQPLGRRDEIRLRLHPEDIALLTAAGGDDGLSRIVPDAVELVPTSTLARGDAIAETGDRTVDARIDAAIDRARAAFGALGA